MVEADLDVVLGRLEQGPLPEGLLQRNRTSLAAVIGLILTRWDAAGSGDNETNVEAIIGAEYEVLDYDSPETDLLAKLVALPIQTESGRDTTDFGLVLSVGYSS